MIISDGPVNRNWNRTVFKGTEEEVELEVKRYLEQYPKNAYMTSALKPQKVIGSDPVLYQVRVERRSSCD